MNSIVLETEKLAFIYFKAHLEIDFQHSKLKLSIFWFTFNFQCKQNFGQNFAQMVS